MALKPGTSQTSDFGDSMAQAMEKALRLHWKQVMPNSSIPFDDKFLKVFFVAIAQGVVSHLENNPDSFKVTVEVPAAGGGAVGVSANGEVSDIETTGVFPELESS